MRDLKKYIQESILDDEDALMSDVKADTVNLFTRMITALNSKMSSYEFH